MIAHPLTAKVPDTSQSDYIALREGIRTTGQIHPIIIKEGMIIDGRNRQTICQELGIEPRYEEYTGSLTVAEYILQANLRRNLTPEQRDAMIIALAKEVVPQMREEAREAKKSGNAKGGAAPRLESQHKRVVSPSDSNWTQKRFRKLIGEPRKADQAISVLNHEDLSAKVEKGELSLRVAAEEAKSRKRASRQQKSPPKVVQPRMEPIKFPTAEETEFPINGTMAEKDAHHRKYGRTPLHPKVIKDMLNHKAVIEGYVMAMLSFTNEIQPETEALFTSFDAMRQWVPKPEKGKDYGTNFAAQARKNLALIKERLPILVRRANELQAALSTDEAKTAQG